MVECEGGPEALDRATLAAREGLRKGTHANWGGGTCTCLYSLTNFPFTTVPFRFNSYTYSPDGIAVTSIVVMFVN